MYRHQTIRPRTILAGLAILLGLVPLPAAAETIQLTIRCWDGDDNIPASACSGSGTS